MLLLNFSVNVLFVPKAPRAYTPSPLRDTLKSFSMGARREKTRKAVRQTTAPTERNTSGSESFGRFDQPGTKGRKEARFICGCESEDWEGNKSAMGKV
jgi:hypothetical protein